MNLPTGLVCKRCGTVFGAIRTAKPVEKLEAVCAKCAADATKKAGVTLDTPENWDVAFT